MEDSSSQWIGSVGRQDIKITGNKVVSEFVLSVRRLVLVFVSIVLVLHTLIFDVI